MVLFIVSTAAIVTVEIFLRFSTIPIVKTLCVASGGALLVLMGGPAYVILGRSGRLAILLALLGYLLLATTRFPGLLKEPDPSLADYGGLMLRTTLFAVLAFALARGGVIIVGLLTKPQTSSRDH